MNVGGLGENSGVEETEGHMQCLLTCDEAHDKVSARPGLPFFQEHHPLQ